jgi:hypothetical protein
LPFGWNILGWLFISVIPPIVFFFSIHSSWSGIIFIFFCIKRLSRAYLFIRLYTRSFMALLGSLIVSYSLFLISFILYIVSIFLFLFHIILIVWLFSFILFPVILVSWVTYPWIGLFLGVCAAAWLAVAVLPSRVMHGLCNSHSRVVSLIIVISTFKLNNDFSFICGCGWVNQNITCLSGQLHFNMGLYFIGNNLNWFIFFSYEFNESMKLGLIGSYHNYFKFIWVTIFQLKLVIICIWLI